MISIFEKTLPQLQSTLTKNGYMDKMYSAIGKEDAVSTMKVALEIVHQTKLVPATTIKRKSKEKVQALFDTVTTMEDCNEMLLYAPNKTDSIFYGYYKRMKLLMEVKAPLAAMKDNETCLSMRPPKKLIDKLIKQKQALLQNIPFENFKNLALHSEFGTDYFTFNVKRHKDIPCVSADVTVVRENGKPKIVAAKNMEIGKVVAVERAFVTDRDNENRLISCYYCLKFSLNLIPCDGCCYVLFCDESCKKSCMEEYHKTECQIMDYIYSSEETARFRLSLKAALKIKQSKSWDEVIAVSRNLGADKITSSTDGEIYNLHNTLSMLHFNRRKHFVHGKMFNHSFLYANIVDKLSYVPDFYPQNEEKKLEAMCALGSIMVHLDIHFPFEIKSINAAQNYLTANVSSEPEPNFGWYSFTSKLTHCCEPNLLAVGLNDKIALLALKPIKKGEELTICHLGHYYENVFVEGRKLKLFESMELMCDCRVCNKNWSHKTRRKAVLDAVERKCFRKWQATVTSLYPDKDRIDFKETCHAMRVLQNYPNTLEHHELFQKFRNSLLAFQYSITENKIVMHSDMFSL